MCRLAGIYDPDAIQLKTALLNMRDSMQRGGPDDAGIYLDGDYPLALGHRRLSLLDLTTAGHQPMSDTAETVQLIFNGEIYNFPELKSELQSLNHTFRTHTDTEVIIAAYKQWGNDCWRRLNGMFAVALWDKDKKQLILVRDSEGIKPLYYHINATQLFFASEVRAFHYLEHKWQENEDWKIHFLLFGFLPEPLTTIKNVFALNAGSYLQIELPSLKVQQHNFLEDIPKISIIDKQEAVTKIKTGLTDAVKRHLISDAPIGLFLSGGVDSSILTLLAQPVLKDNLKTLSLQFDEALFSEEKYQQIIAQEANAAHKAFKLSAADFETSFTDILDAIDQPSLDGINTYFIARNAKEYGLKAVLSGVGADEIFGGYPSFDRVQQWQQLRKLPCSFFSAIEPLLPGKWKKISFLSLDNLLSFYLLNRGIYTIRQVANMLGITVNRVYTALATVQLPQLSTIKDGADVMLLEKDIYLRGQLLKDADYMSMWHSIEIRTPFLDKELLHIVRSISPDILYGPGQRKMLLIEAFNDILPEAIWNRPKQGFVLPFDAWMRKDAHMDIGSDNPIKRDFINGKINWSRYWTSILVNEFSH